MMYIVMTALQAATVEGESSPGAFLRPIKLTDDFYVLPVAVLSDVAHGSKWPLLNLMEQREVESWEWPVNE